MARSIFLVVTGAKMSEVINAAAVHADAYAPTQITALDNNGSSFGVLFYSAAAVNPEANDDKFTEWPGNPLT